MGRKQITFSVPEGVYKYIENRVNDAGYGTVASISEISCVMTDSFRSIYLIRQTAIRLPLFMCRLRHIGSCWPQPPAEGDFCSRLGGVIINLLLSRVFITDYLDAIK